MVLVLALSSDDIYIHTFFLIQKKSVEGGKQGASIKKLKKDKAVSATVKSARPEATTVPTAPRVKPELTLPVM
jgi:transcription initiation factor TFIID subunit 5